MLYRLMKNEIFVNSTIAVYLQ